AGEGEPPVAPGPCAPTRSIAGQGSSAPPAANPAVRRNERRRCRIPAILPAFIAGVSLPQNWASTRQCLQKFYEKYLCFNRRITCLGKPWRWITVAIRYGGHQVVAL